MKSVMFRCPIKPGKLAEFKAFIEQCKARSEEWLDMLKRYDMHGVKIWLDKHEGKDFAYVSHTVGDQFKQKIAQWHHSKHHFDSWFREALMDLYDMADSEEMLELDQVAEL